MTDAPARVLAKGGVWVFGLLLSCSGTSSSGGGSSAAGGSGGAHRGGNLAGDQGGSAGASPDDAAAPASGDAAGDVGESPEASSNEWPEGFPDACSGICNAITASYPEVTSSGLRGNVTEYTTSASKGGACLYGETSVVYFAAINVNLEPGDGKGQWQGGTFCGQCIEVTVLTSQGPKSLVVRIMDKCPDVYCGVDLGGLAPSTLMVDGYGRYDGTWRTVSCAGHPEVFDGEPSLYVKDGANPYWSVVQVRNPMAAVLGIDWQSTSDSSQQGTLALTEVAENFYAVPQALLSAGDAFRFAIRYSDGTTGGVTVTSAQLSQASAAYPLDR